MTQNQELPEGILTDDESVIITTIDEKGLRIKRIKKKRPDDCNKTVISKDVMKAFCGGKFPKDNDGFCYECVDHWEIEEGSDRYVAYVYGEPIGPDLKFISLKSTL
jgi:hypothetical protein